MELNYPEHKHPHGVADTKPNPARIWVCTECQHIFTDEVVRQNVAEWGHPCKQTGQRCESHLEPYQPAIKLTKLTRRKRQILTLVGQGLTVKEIAWRLSCSEQTIKNHLYGVHKALDCTTTAGALVKCLKAGIITLEDC